MLINIDHLALAVRDLDTATAQYTALLGRAPSWRGRDGSIGGIEHVRFQLENMALDIVAPSGPGPVGDRVRTHLESAGEGVWALAFGTADIAKTRSVLERRGIAASQPLPIRSTHVGTQEQCDWIAATLDDAATHGATLAVLEQKPDSARWPLSALQCEPATAIDGLDHVVITTAQPERAVALYGARLGLDLKLDRSNPEWGSRLMFFKCGDLIVEVAHDLKKGLRDEPDRFWGLSWRANDIHAAHKRLADAGIAVSEVRNGRKPGTQVFTVRDGTANVPTIVLGRAR